MIACNLESAKVLLGISITPFSSLRKKGKRKSFSFFFSFFFLLTNKYKKNEKRKKISVFSFYLQSKLILNIVEMRSAVMSSLLTLTLWVLAKE